MRDYKVVVKEGKRLMAIGITGPYSAATEYLYQQRRRNWPNVPEDYRDIAGALIHGRRVERTYKGVRIWVSPIYGPLGEECYLCGDIVEDYLDAGSYFGHTICASCNAAGIYITCAYDDCLEPVEVEGDLCPEHRDAHPCMACGTLTMYGLLCDSCEFDYFICEDCGEAREAHLAVEHEGGFVCAYCIDEYATPLERVGGALAHRADHAPIRVGFEVEGLIASDTPPGAYHAENTGWSIAPYCRFERDSSLELHDEQGAYAGEVITPPLAPTDAFEVLATILRNREDFDASCGIHTNLSAIGDSVDYYPAYARAEALLYALNGIHARERWGSIYAPATSYTERYSKVLEDSRKYCGFNPKRKRVEYRHISGALEADQVAVAAAFTYAVHRMQHDALELGVPLPMPGAGDILDLEDIVKSARLWGLLGGPEPAHIWPYDASRAPNGLPDWSSIRRIVREALERI